MIGFWKKFFRASPSPRPIRVKVGMAVEALEGRQLLSTASEYSLSGFSWSNPAKITYSFPSDGVSWDFGTNDLHAKLNSSFSGDGWKREFARALQTWAASSNINVVPVSDSNAKFNAYGKSQGDANFGDIRVGGYDFGNKYTLAQTYYPPPNSVTAGGDVEVNTAFDWKPGNEFDFFSVMLHETGHSFGLAHTDAPGAVLDASYGGFRTGLSGSDVAGIQALYGARVPDVYNKAGLATSFGNAVDVSGKLNGRQGTLDGVWLTSIGETDYYSIVAPAITGSTLTLTAAAAGISSLSPKITVFDASQNPLGTKSDPSKWSDNVSVAVANAAPGQRYIVAVTGATDDVFAVGAYQLQFSFSGGTPIGGTPVTPPVSPPTPGGGTPVVLVPNPPTTPAPITPPSAPPTTPTPPAILADRFEPNDATNSFTNLGIVSQTTVTGLTLDRANDVDLFKFQVAKAGNVKLLNTGGYTRVINEAGQVVAAGTGELNFRAGRARARFILVVSTPNNAPVAGYAIGIDVQAAPKFATKRLRQVARNARQVVDVVAPDRVSTETNWAHTRVAVGGSEWLNLRRAIAANRRRV